MGFTWKRMYVLVIAAAFLLSLPGLLHRWGVESSRRSSVILTDWTQISCLGSQSGRGREELLQSLVDAGVRGVMVRECVGDDLSSGALSLWYGPVSQLAKSLRSGLSVSSGTALVFPSSDPRADLWRSFLSLRFPQGTMVSVHEQDVFVIPASQSELALQGILPDWDGLETAAGLGLPVIYRPAPASLQPAGTVAASVRAVCQAYPNVVGLSPSGDIVSGYPDLSPLADLVRERGLFVTQVEFSRQIGDKPLQWAVWPRVLSLHSVTDEEVMVRRIDRRTMVSRMVRAGVERSVSFLLLRADPMGGGEALERYLKDVRELRRCLADRKLDDRWPVVLSSWGSSPTGALSVAFLCLLYGWSLVRRFRDDQRPVAAKSGLIFVLVSVVLALGMIRLSILGRLMGGVTTGLAATEGCLLSLSWWRKPGRAMLVGPIVAIVGGMAVASFYSAPLYMMRLTPFSGVKLTLFLPILLVVCHDFARRVHPESWGELLSRPPLWIELFLAGILVAAAGLMVLRSGNVSSVPGWEISLRESLESWLVARPRTKEAFLGYPCLILWMWVRRNEWIPRYREILRLGATVAFSSLVNTFCHFHTRLSLTVLRTFNGWWVGIVVGVAVVFVLGIGRRFVKRRLRI